MNQLSGTPQSKQDDGDPVFLKVLSNKKKKTLLCNIVHMRLRLVTHECARGCSLVLSYVRVRAHVRNTVCALRCFVCALRAKGANLC